MRLMKFHQIPNNELISYPILSADGTWVHDGRTECAESNAAKCNAKGYADGDASWRWRPGLPTNSAQWAHDETTAAATAAGLPTRRPIQVSRS